MKKAKLRELLKNRENKPEIFIGYTQVIEEVKPAKKKAKKGEK